MTSPARLIVVGCITLLAGLVSLFPARVAYRWLPAPTFNLAGISGSAWNGQASQMKSGSLYLQDLQWRIKPLSLFVGQLRYQIEGSPASGFIDGQVSLNLSGTVTASDLRGSMSLQPFGALVGIRGLSGTINGEFVRLVIENGLPVAANGQFEVLNLIAPNIHRTSIGGYRAEFFTQESGVVASVEDTDGLIDVAGSLQLSADRTYKFVAQLAPKHNTPANVRQQLQLLGSANERGQHELRLEGRL
jgi:general secretion pathway protein N